MSAAIEQSYNIYTTIYINIQHILVCMCVYKFLDYRNLFITRHQCFMKENTAEIC